MMGAASSIGGETVSMQRLQVTHLPPVDSTTEVSGRISFYARKKDR
jgi:hypothetical protein